MRVKDTALYDHRIGYNTLADGRKREALLAWIAEVPANSVMMFNYSFGTDELFLSLEEHKRRAELFKTIVPRISELGAVPAINVMATMGHGNKRASVKERYGFQPVVVGPTGAEVEGGACALDPAFLEYVYGMYRLYATTGARHIWTDDDIRFPNHGVVSDYCFCPLHMAEMERRSGKKWTVESLYRALGRRKDRETYDIWFGINRDAMLALFRRVEEAIHAVDSGIRIGMMTCGLSVGRDIDAELRILRGRGAEPLLRPGGLYWSDQDLCGALRKKMLVRSECPFEEKGVETSYELENFPYGPYQKSMTAMALEMRLNILDGLDRIALNIFDDVGGAVDPMGNYGELLRAQHPYLASLREAIAGMKPCGVHVARNRDLGRNKPFVAWSMNLLRLGIPAVFDHENAAPVVLGGSACCAYSDEELSRMVSAGALIDGDAMLDLVDRGIFSREEIEVEAGAFEMRNIACERFTDHPLNRNLLSRRREGARGSLELVARVRDGEKWQVLSEWIDLDGKVFAPALLARMGAVPSLVFPYPVGEGALLTRERQYQVVNFLRQVPAFRGVWISDLNCAPVMYSNGSSVVLGVARVSLDFLQEMHVWLSPRIEGPAKRVEVLNDSGEWEPVGCELQKPPEQAPGTALVLRHECRPMSVNVFRWET